ncbi:DEAD/DEAH box helicase [Paenisporosarcina sp. NPDC076898]|uniref:DEAD/DEAH box helicase n=1 Tax=unclassified Paenisporosarcina TaxID=2642018 RepID=UPI003D057D7D
MTFIENLKPELQNKWKFEYEMPVQSQLIPNMLEGKDVVAQSPTGSGKTLAYVLPILNQVDGAIQKTQALIVAPSQELSMQIVEVLRDWTADTDITVAQLIGGANMARQLEKLKKKPTIVVGTPGRLNELVKSKKLKLHDIRHIILDEGDQLLAREHRGIVKSLIDGSNHDRQIVVVSATITEEIELVASRMMKEPIRIHVSHEELPAQGKVVHSFVKVEERDKTDLLRRLAHVEGMRGLAFINNLDQLLMKETKLKFRDAKIVALHSDMKKEERKQALASFRKGEVSILIATDIAARGLDIEGLTHVIHVDVPHAIEPYLHRSGRTGRAGADGEVMSLLTYKDEKNFKKWTKELPSKPVQKIWDQGQLIEGSSKTVQQRGKKK